MIQDNQKRFNELIAEMIALFDDTTTSVRINISGGGGIKMTETFRYPDELKKSNISMRNIKGDFIKKN